MPAPSAVTASGPAANGSPGSSAASRKSSGDRLRQIRAAVPAQASGAVPEGRGPEAVWTRNRGSLMSGASSGRTPTTWCALRPGSRVYVVNVSRSACSRGSTAVARAIHRATSALCRSTRTTRGAEGSSHTRRRSLSTAAIQGLRATAKSPSPSLVSPWEGPCAPAMVVSGSGSVRSGVADSHPTAPQAATGSTRPGIATPGGRWTACAWNPPVAVATVRLRR